MTFRPRYLAASLALLAVLVLIALFVRDAFVRPFLGDVLALVWLYLTARAFVARAPVVLATAALSVAYLLEFAQYLGAADALGLSAGSPLRVAIGSTFDPLDLLAYTLGWAGALAAERARGVHE